ncbi:MAG: AraC family transcriptional regulator [Deltaproteobacteria bacterium]|nr:AraC family transcriptional regulator [Deltaproteobacteria bacterium]
MPKPKFLSSGYCPGTAVALQYFEEPHFPNPLHYHKELELAYIISGYGTRFIGSNIEPFKKGDLVLVGEELAHVWKCDEAFYEPGTSLLTKAIVVKFHADFAGNDFLRLQESHSILKVINEATGGIRIRGKSKRLIHNILHEMLEQSPIEQILSLLQILNVMSKSETTSVLSQFDFHRSSNPKEKDRMNRIIQHTMINFKRNITLDEIANVANLSKSAFCRYFKNTVKKNYNDFIYDIRIEYACKLLLEKDMGIMQVCYESGFNNPSAFSQIFKRITGISPNQYRKTYKIQEISESAIEKANA